MTTSLKLWLNQFDVLLKQLWYIWHMFLENKRTYILIRAGADLVRHKHKQKSRCYPGTGAHQFKGFYFLICFIIASLLCQGTECGLIVSDYFHACSILLTFVWLPCGLKNTWDVVADEENTPFSQTVHVNRSTKARQITLARKTLDLGVGNSDASQQGGWIKVGWVDEWTDTAKVAGHLAPDNIWEWKTCFVLCEGLGLAVELKWGNSNKNW